MQIHEVLFAEPVFDEQRHGERVADGERGRRARGRHEIQRARFRSDAAVDRHVGRLGKRRTRTAGNRDQFRAEAADRFEQP